MDVILISSYAIEGFEAVKQLLRNIESDWLVPGK